MNILKSFIALIYISFNTATIYHVDPNAMGTPDGLTWTNAYTTLEPALTSATTASDEIWLKGGETYTPMTTVRDDCFEAQNGIKIYGGFDGTETSISERPTIPSETIISGNINTNDQSDNCYHVLTYNQQLTLDTITISDGFADLQSEATYNDQTNVLHKYGAALIASNTRRPTQLYLNNIKFTNNYALNGGALFFRSNDNNDVNVVIRNCIFENNVAMDSTLYDGKYEGGYGGAIYLYFLSNITVYNTKFVNNNATFRGGAVYQDYGGIFQCNECEFNGNRAIEGYGGALFSEDRNSQTDGTFPKIIDSNFTDNSAAIYGGAICFFNNVEGETTNVIFNSNSAGMTDGGGAIATIWSEIVNNNPTFIGNTPNDMYNETEFVYEEIDHDLSMNVDTYVERLHDTFVTIQNNPDLFAHLMSPSVDVCYVDIDSTPPRDGTNWNRAYRDLQDCLDKLNSVGGEVWVKQGTYVPTRIPQWKLDLNRNSAQQRSFILYDNITLLGGFVGTESEKNDRDFVNYKTYLSCEINAKNNKYCSQIMMAADNTVVDGFIFIKAQNTMVNVQRRCLQAAAGGGGNSISILEVLTSTSGVVGGGIYTNSTNIKVANTVFYKLFSAGKGGGVYCIGLEAEGCYPGCETVIKSPTFINIAFLGNRAASRGGAISADVNCHFSCEYCTFEKNSCSKKGGAVYLDFDCDPKIRNSDWRNNYALESGGGIAADGASYVTFEANTTFINNSANWEGGALYSGSGVGPTKTQGFSFDDNEFNDNTTFSLNHLRFDGVGQSDIYLWPYSTINEVFTDLIQESSASMQCND